MRQQGSLGRNLSCARRIIAAAKNMVGRPRIWYHTYLPCFAREHGRHWRRILGACATKIEIPIPVAYATTIGCGRAGNRWQKLAQAWGTITLLAQVQLAVVARASLAFSSGKRCVTIALKGNCSAVLPRNWRAACMWRGLLDQEP